MEHIDDYMSGKMSAVDKAAFEAEMLQDAELKQLVENYDTVKEISSGILEAELLSEVKGVANAAQSSGTNSIPNTISRKPLNIWRIAVLILVLVGLAIYLIQPNFLGSSLIPHERVASLNVTHYQKPKLENITKSSNIEGKSPAESAKLYFERNDFINSKNLWLKIIEQTTDKAKLNEAHYYLGHSYYGLGRLEHKLDYFNKARSYFNQSVHKNSECLILLCDVITKKIPKEDLEAKCPPKN